MDLMLWRNLPRHDQHWVQDDGSPCEFDHSAAWTHMVCFRFRGKTCRFINKTSGSILRVDASNSPSVFIDTADGLVLYVQQGSLPSTLDG
jgi:hypothetical protein